MEPSAEDFGSSRFGLFDLRFEISDLRFCSTTTSCFISFLIADATRSVFTNGLASSIISDSFSMVEK